jgi:UDP-glucose 4-epimerase
MSRVLITGGCGLVGGALARRLLADPAYDVRIADQRPAPRWMREGCEVRHSDLRIAAQAHAAVRGCTHVVHLAGFGGIHGGVVVEAGDADDSPPPEIVGSSTAHTRIEYESVLHSAVVRAALDRAVERFVYVSSPLVFEHAEEFPTPEAHLAQCPAPASAAGFSRLAGERCCRAARDEHGFPFVICRPFATYGPGQTRTREPGVSELLGQLAMGAVAGARPLQIAAAAEHTLAPTHVDDVAGAIVLALGSPAAVGEDFNVASPRKLSVAQVARVLWQAAGEDPDLLELEQIDGGEDQPARSWPAVDKAHELLGWRARIAFEDGAGAMLGSLRERVPGPGRIGSAV